MQESFPARLLSVSGSPPRYSWVEQGVEPFAGGLMPAASPRMGTDAREMNDATVATPCFASMRVRGGAAGDVVCEFSKDPSQSWSQSNGAGGSWPDVTASLGVPLLANDTWAAIDGCTMLIPSPGTWLIHVSVGWVCAVAAGPKDEVVYIQMQDATNGNALLLTTNGSDTAVQAMHKTIVYDEWGLTASTFLTEVSGPIFPATIQLHAWRGSHSASANDLYIVPPYNSIGIPTQMTALSLAPATWSGPDGNGSSGGSGLGPPPAAALTGTFTDTYP